MKILKRPVNIIYDTDYPNRLEFDPAVTAIDRKPLHHFTQQTDYDFLQEHFKGPDHPIYNDFGNSYFYKL